MCSSSSSSSSLSLFLHPPPPSSSPHRHVTIKLHSLTFKSRQICFSTSNPSSFDAGEESRWLREERRWLREEQRWLREEQRWARERDALLREIAELRLQIQSLQAGSSSGDGVANIAGLLQTLKDKNLIAETGSSPRALELVEGENVKAVKVELDGKNVKLDGENVKEVKEVFTVTEMKLKSKKEDLRKGSAEGERVKALQEALMKLGFYSGEEDMEFSNFSSGTDRAVKTWQASIGAPQDGIVTEELLLRLFLEAGVTEKEDGNGAAVTSVTELSEVKQTVVKEDSADVDVNHHRVFLLGENRWEEPSRLIHNKKVGASSGTTTKCLTCRGEGRLLCTECDGTGEPNIEEQFMEWIDEGAKCPYCEGLGFTICDVCEGKQ